MRSPSDRDDLAMFAWLVHATVKYDNVDLSRPEPDEHMDSMYGVGLGDPANTQVEWFYGRSLREAIRAAMEADK